MKFKYILILLLVACGKIPNDPIVTNDHNETESATPNKEVDLSPTEPPLTTTPTPEAPKSLYIPSSIDSSSIGGFDQLKASDESYHLALYFREKNETLREYIDSIYYIKVINGYTEYSKLISAPQLISFKSNRIAKIPREVKIVSNELKGITIYYLAKDNLYSVNLNKKVTLVEENVVGFDINGNSLYFLRPTFNGVILYKRSIGNEYLGTSENIYTYHTFTSSWLPNLQVSQLESTTLIALKYKDFNETKTRGMLLYKDSIEDTYWHTQVLARGGSEATGFSMTIENGIPIFCYVGEDNKLILLQLEKLGGLPYTTTLDRHKIVNNECQFSRNRGTTEITVFNPEHSIFDIESYQNPESLLSKMKKYKGVYLGDYRYQKGVYFFTDGVRVEI